MRDLEARPTILDISRLKSGLVVKGYKDMCELLGVKAYDRSCRRRTLQEEDWRRYFEWEEVSSGRLRRITYIKEFPDIVPPPPNAVYVKLIEMMVVYKLANLEVPEIEMTWPDLFEFLGMVNEKFKDHRNFVAYKYINQDIRPISEIGYVDWGVRARGGFKRKLRTALNSMQRRQLIIWDEVLYCVLDTSDMDGDGMNGKRFETHVVAGPDEKGVKTEAYRYVLQNIYHMDSEDQIIAKGKYYEYLDRVNEYLKDNYKILRFYTKVRISYRYKTVEGAIEATRNNLAEMAAEFDFNVKWDELTDKLIEMLKNEASNKHIGARNKIDGYLENNSVNEDTENDMKRFVYFESDDYLLEQELFSQYFISRYATDDALREKYGVKTNSKDSCLEADLKV